MLESAGLNIDFLVDQIIKCNQPDLFLDRLSHNPFPESRLPLRKSTILRYNNQPIPMVPLSEDEKLSLREEVNSALARLAVKRKNSVPKVSLNRIKEKHQARVSLEKSPEKKNSSESNVRSVDQCVVNIPNMDEGLTSPNIEIKPLTPSYSNSPTISRSFKSLQDAEKELADLRRPVLAAKGKGGENEKLTQELAEVIADGADDDTSHETSLQVTSVLQSVEAPVTPHVIPISVESEQPDDGEVSTPLCETQLTLLSTLERSPPSASVFKHLEALEAAIELDMSIRSQSSYATPSSRRKLDLESPRDTPMLNLELDGIEDREISGPSDLGSSPLQQSHVDTGSSLSSPGRPSVSFYVDIDQSSEPKLSRENSPRPKLSRRNTISSPRSKSNESSPRSSLGRRNTISSRNVKPKIRQNHSNALSSVNTAIKKLGDNPVLQPLITSPSARVRNNSFNTTKSTIIDGKASIINALARGFLTRRLLRSYKVQQHIKTVKDTEELLATGPSISEMSDQDRSFYNHLNDTLLQTKDKVWNIFFDTSIHDQMSLIAHTRAARMEKKSKISNNKNQKSGRRVKNKVWI